MPCSTSHLCFDVLKLVINITMNQLTILREVLDFLVMVILPYFLQVLELSAVADNRPELDRRYLVTLLDPGQGATLDHNQTTCELVILENDAPYGEFQVWTTEIR